ncbi:glycosyl hydrolase [Streptomyces sp. NPDC002643]
MPGIDEHRSALAKPPIEYRPELRWWLAEGLHTDVTLRREVEQAFRLGFGGLEFLAMDEEGIDHSRYGWGSEEWVHDSELIVRETTERGMSVSFTSGTNWSNANVPTIDADHPAASQELDYTVESVRPGDARKGPLRRIDLSAPPVHSTRPRERVAPTVQHLAVVVAVPVVDDTVLDAAGALDLTPDVVEEELGWEVPDDREWRIFTFWRLGTGQTASPSVSVNYTVNYLERAGVDAVIDYWRAHVLTDTMKENIRRNPRAQMYMDSLEIVTYGRGGLFWGEHFAEEFSARRGYRIERWLPFLTRNVPLFAPSTTYQFEPEETHRITVEKVRHDYVRTLTDLYIENMLRPFAAFLHENGIQLRAEISYGLPFELTRPGPEVDTIETESLEFGSQIDAYRMLAGPAHLFGKQYSSETGATTRNHMLDHRFYDQIIATQFAAGVTKTVLHGWASMAGAEDTTRWPGHEGMWPAFGERFDLRQPGSEFYPLWNDAMGRYQYLLRQGKPRVDVGILRTDHFVDNTSGVMFIDAEGHRVPDEDAYGRMWMRDRHNHWWRDLGMQDAGWSYDFFDGSLLLDDAVSFDQGEVQPDGPGYQALIVYQQTLDPDVAKLLLDWATRGLKVLIVNGARELKHLASGTETVHERAATRTQGLDGRDDELATTMSKIRALPTVAEIDDPADTVEALRRLGVRGRAEFAAPDQNVLTCLREEGDLLHLYAYHFLYETGAPTTVDITLPGEGTAYRVDAWSGGVRQHPATRAENGRTVLTVSLHPGETALFTVDRSNPFFDAVRESSAEVAQLSDWTITVESWDAGANEVIVEDRGHGYITREIRPLTKVTSLAVGQAPLRPWRDLPGVGPEVSGVAEYRSTFSAPLPSVAGTRYLLDLGSTDGGLGSVVVNDGSPRGYDTSRPLVDITEDMLDGENTVVIRVSSSLNNRLIARGYYDDIPDVGMRLFGRDGHTHMTRVRDHGLVGPVRLLTHQESLPPRPAAATSQGPRWSGGRS